MIIDDKRVKYVKERELTKTDELLKAAKALFLVSLVLSIFVLIVSQAYVSVKITQKARSEEGINTFRERVDIAAEKARKLFNK